MGSIKDLVTETSIPRHKNLIEALFGVKCERTEENNGRIEWTWERPDSNDFVNILNDNKDVKFHRNFSSGTAVVRGAQPMTNDQYFWELKMISPVYGTDMMVGIGTPEADMSQVHDKFVSLLGSDKQTWGLSYTGLFHHNGESRSYASRFGQGCTIGVHLDLWNGTLSFYKNKKHLGIASRGLTGKTLYAMASSTAACSGMRIVRSCSFPSSLQFLCCAKLRELIPDEKSVLKAVQMPPGLKLYLENNLGWFLDSRFTECVLYPSLSKRKMHSALKPNSNDPLLANVGTEEENEDGYQRQSDDDDEGCIMIGNRPFLLCGRRMGLPAPPRLSPFRSRFRTVIRATNESSSSVPSFERRNAIGQTSNASFVMREQERFDPHTYTSPPGQASNEAPAEESNSFTRFDCRNVSTNLFGRMSGNLLGQASSESSVDLAPTFDTMDDFGGILDLTDEEEDPSLESPPKRPCSYNYIVGLSDSDREDEPTV